MNAMTTESNMMSDAQPKQKEAQPFLSVKDVHAYYGESYIVQGVSLDLPKGEILALLGRNGAGKTSTLRTLARVDDPQLTQGEIWLDGQPLHKMRAHEAAQAGLQLVPEDRRIIQGLTVEENLTLAQVAPGHGWTVDQVYERFPRLAERRNQEGVTLSGGEQQMLAIGRALVRDVKLLLLDEPYEGLAPVIVQEIEKILLEIKKLGITTIIVEQNAVAALKLADKAVIFDTGEVVFSGSAKEVLDNEQLRHEYLAI
ncbi:ABC transporter ATP-binding protein [Maritalea sp. S77]|uniref:ABC transporter ATP-binding protein n=1 Tax=Maritalea sp. S77 TaxID=3415125 RepID=UPI003C7ED772